MTKKGDARNAAQIKHIWLLLRMELLIRNGIAIPQREQLDMWKMLQTPSAPKGSTSNSCS